MNYRGAVGRDRTQNAVANQIADDWPEADLERMRSHHEEERSPAATRVRDRVREFAQISCRKNLGQRVEEAAHRSTRLDGRRELLALDDPRKGLKLLRAGRRRVDWT